MGLFYNQIFDDQSRRANSVFYARNLETGDIEGSKPGTLVSKAIKNKNLAGRMRELSPPSDALPSISLNCPYGRVHDRDNTVDMPLYLQKARFHKVPQYRTGDEHFKNYERRPAGELFKYGETQLRNTEGHNLGNR